VQLGLWFSYGQLRDQLADDDADTRSLAARAIPTVEQCAIAQRVAALLQARQRGTVWEMNKGGLVSVAINRELQRSTTMGIKLTYITPLLAAAAAALAIAAAPTAAAATNGQQTCSGNICQSPGNVQIKNTPPPVQYYPYGTMPFLLGGHGGGLLGGLF
jgi:hypothetical protein